MKTYGIALEKLVRRPVEELESLVEWRWSSSGDSREKWCPAWTTCPSCWKAAMTDGWPSRAATDYVDQNEGTGSVWQIRRRGGGHVFAARDQLHWRAAIDVFAAASLPVLPQPLSFPGARLRDLISLHLADYHCYDLRLGTLGFKLFQLRFACFVPSKVKEIGSWEIIFSGGNDPSTSSIPRKYKILAVLIDLRELGLSSTMAIVAVTAISSRCDSVP